MGTCIPVELQGDLLGCWDFHEAPPEMKLLGHSFVRAGRLHLANKGSWAKSLLMKDQRMRLIRNKTVALQVQLPPSGQSGGPYPVIISLETLDSKIFDSVLLDIQGAWAILRAGSSPLPFSDEPEEDTGQLLHISVVYQGTRIMFYKNGRFSHDELAAEPLVFPENLVKQVVLGFSSSLAAILNNCTPEEVGGHFTGGQFAHVSLFGRALTGEEVEKLHRSSARVTDNKVSRPSLLRMIVDRTQELEGIKDYQKSTEFGDRQAAFESLGEYPMWRRSFHETRGFALIISMEAVEGAEGRVGGQEDRSKLEQQLQSLKFEVVTYVDAPAEVVKSGVKQYASHPHNKGFDCFLCIVMAHGSTDSQGRGYVVDPAGAKSLLGGDVGREETRIYIKRDLLDCVCNPSVAYLRDKPKIVVVNACRTGESSPQDTVAHRDLFVAYSTPGLHVSQRTAGGSVYIANLLRKLADWKNGEYIDVQVLFTQAANLDNSNQVPVTVNTLRFALFWRTTRPRV